MRTEEEIRAKYNDLNKDRYNVNPGALAISENAFCVALEWVLNDAALFQSSVICGSESKYERVD